MLTYMQKMKFDVPGYHGAVLSMTKCPIDKNSPKSFWDDQHKRLAGDQYEWIHTAYDLAQAFEILVKESREEMSSNCCDISKPAIFLGALAIENLLKAIRISQLSSIFNARGEFVLDTHDLLTLVSDAGIKVSEEESVNLERLWQFIVWAGRYPIPLFSNDMRPRTLPGGGYAPRTAYPIPQVYDEIAKLISRFKSMLPKP